MKKKLLKILVTKTWSTKNTLMKQMITLSKRMRFNINKMTKKVQSKPTKLMIKCLNQLLIKQKNLMKTINTRTTSKMDLE